MPFSYFGRKSRIAHHYPRPIHDTIDKAFAGSAGYSLHADHWTRRVVLVEYTLAPDLEATYFIDPPYQRITHGYDSDRSGLDFGALAEWCLTRQGQIIVAEESGANWLPFRPLTAKRTINNTPTIEVVYTNTIDTLFEYGGLE